MILCLNKMLLGVIHFIWYRCDVFNNPKTTGKNHTAVHSITFMQTTKFGRLSLQNINNVPSDMHKLQKPQLSVISLISHRSWFDWSTDRSFMVDPLCYFSFSQCSMTCTKVVDELFSLWDGAYKRPLHVNRCYRPRWRSGYVIG